MNNDLAVRPITLGQALATSDIILLNNYRVADADLRRYQENGFQCISIIVPGTGVVPLIFEEEQRVEVDTFGNMAATDTYGDVHAFMLIKEVSFVTERDIRQAAQKASNKPQVAKHDLGSSEHMVRQMWVADSEQALKDEFHTQQRRWPTPGYGTMMYSVVHSRSGPHTGQWTAVFSRGKSCD